VTVKSRSGHGQVMVNSRSGHSQVMVRSRSGFTESFAYNSADDECIRIIYNGHSLNKLHCATAGTTDLSPSSFSI
jgi:hypothetical protein